MPKKTTNDESTESSKVEQGSLGTSTESPQTDRAETLQGVKAHSQEEWAAAFKSVRERANRGDRRSQAVLIKYFDEHPEMWAKFGEMAGYAESALIETITQGEWLTAQAIKRRAAELRQELSRPSQSPLEDLAVQRLAACWMQLQFVESMCAQAHGDIARAKFWLQRQQQVHKLYAAAEKSLLMVRGLLPASVQLASMTNVAVCTNISGANGTQAAEKVTVPAETHPVTVAEGPAVKFGGVNRISGVMDAMHHAADSTGEQDGDGLRRVNGNGEVHPDTCAAS